MADSLAGCLVTDTGTAVDARMQAQELFSAHFGRLASWCARLSGDEEVGRDLAAEAFSRLWARWRTVDDAQAFLYVTAANLVREGWRRAGRERRAIALWRIGQSAVVGPPDSSVADLIERLPARLREPVLLHYYADLPIAQVARALGRTEGTVKRWLHEARLALGEMSEASDG